MRRRHCRRMRRRARLLRKHLSEFTSWSQLLKKSGFPRFRRKWQVYKPIIELSTSNKTGKPESTVDNRRLHSLRIECQANRRSVPGQKSASGKLHRPFRASGFATKARLGDPPQTSSGLKLALMGRLSLRGLGRKAYRLD